MLGEMTSAQFSEWLAYSRIEPWGEERDDLRIGILASMIANMFREKGKKPAKPSDFILDFGLVDEEAKAKRALASLQRVLGGGRR
jgi:hypothetical protein